MSRRSVRVALTLGDPGGIGPELVARVVSDPPRGVVAMAVGASGHLAAGAERAGISHREVERHLLDSEGPSRVSVGRPSRAAGVCALRAIETAVRLARAGEVDAIATAPVSKQSLALAGVPHPGHTDLLAELTGSHSAGMVFVAGPLRVGLVTVHVPLSEVAERITRRSVADGIRMLSRALATDFAAEHASIRVAALNPHLGEGGLLGREELDAIVPAVRDARRRGIPVEGPNRPEELFGGPRRGPVRGVLALYHDQALGPLKASWGQRMVNVTVGLPLVRTSPDHGTAFDIVGDGTASDASLRLAATWAARIHRNRTAGRISAGS